MGLVLILTCQGWHKARTVGHACETYSAEPSPPRSALKDLRPSRRGDREFLSRLGYGPHMPADAPVTSGAGTDDQEMILGAHLCARGRGNP